ncbi:MAG: BTAD domain-containing putative transcriptional regulator [Planctomycetota bacterium]|nr:BTAD domain-containing putative transcriptional regulator [Planctomycetota bacterium]MDP6761793.1 BTAD domain-containing putative transcriptional regulator [Planctomycetota bacterium]MDP6988440.1 BTAD domain-containing putative transcriptional regulator [Planctomycetota bacterium]
MRTDPIDPDPRLRETLDRVGTRFLTMFFEIETHRHPDNLDALAELGQLYTRLGRWENGLGVDRRLVRLVPHNPTVHYNLACSLALLGRSDDALDALERSVELGYDDFEFLQSDPDLVSLRNEARFRGLVRLLQTDPT